MPGEQRRRGHREHLAPPAPGDQPGQRREPQRVARLLLVIVAIVLGTVGVVAKGLLYLLFIGIVVLLGALVLGALRMRRQPGRRAAR